MVLHRPIESAVVTGGGSGIGRATVERLHAAGATVVMGDISDSTSLAESLGVGFARCDVTVEDDVRTLLESAVATHRRLDILMNNAGVYSGYRPLAETDQSGFDRSYRVNVLGTAFGPKHAANLMTDGGRIVNTASAAGVTGAIGLADYVASKHAVVGLTRAAALELGPRHIRVNCVCPTTVDTPMAHEAGGEFMLDGEKLLVPLGRICQPEEVAALIHFLIANDCGFING